MECVVLSWLFGSRKKKRVPPALKKTVPKREIVAKPPKRNSVEIADKMGGPENIAQIIRALLKEDN